MEQKISELKARDCMLRDPMTIPPTEQIAAADLLMIRNNIGGLLVVDDGKLVGILTLRDILISRFSHAIGGIKVRDLMTKDVITVTPDTPLKEVLEIYAKKGIERIPVVENEHLIGMVIHKTILEKLYELL
ncbi:MAG: CBS domain-containing protein [Candidatus Helarchaeales archaeon]